MRLVSFDDYRIGVLSGTNIYDVTEAVAAPWRGTPFAMNELIAGFSKLRDRLERTPQEGRAVPLSGVTLRAPIERPMHLLAAPNNYLDHTNEMKGKVMATNVPGPKSPKDLGFFLKATGSICGPSDAIELPAWPDRLFHHEGELGVVIGSPTRAVSPKDAVSHIFGYTCVIDVTMRMSETHREERVMRKSFSNFTPVGPVIVTADEATWDSFQIKLWVGDELRQNESSGRMVTGVPDLVSLASEVLELQPGDLYATGTPAGVGGIKAGDTVTVEIDKIGRMSLPVRQRSW